MLIPQPTPWSPAGNREIADAVGNVVQYTHANIGLICLAVNQNERMSAVLAEIERITAIAPFRRMQTPGGHHLSVAMSKTMNLNVGMALAHNSDPGVGRKATDTLLTTGVSVKFD